jgi:branched-chain amino acid transport system ATP-binding protein
MTDLLVVENLSKRFRGLQAVKDVSFAVPDHRIVALIGPNGAGKTTTFNLIAGALPPDTGRVRLAGADLLGLRPDQVCGAGVARTFQLVKPFAELSVEDNVLVGALHRRHRIADARAHARAVIELVALGPLRQRLATEPRILLLDEVMAGLRPTETDRMVGVLRTLNRDTGMTILLIEHVMRAVMALSDHVIVLDQGEKISAGAPETVVRDPRVIACYLGPEAVA